MSKVLTLQSPVAFSHPKPRTCTLIPLSTNIRTAISLKYDIKAIENEIRHITLSLLCQFRSLLQIHDKVLLCSFRNGFGFPIKSSRQFLENHTINLREILKTGINCSIITRDRVLIQNIMVALKTKADVSFPKCRHPQL